MRPICGGHCGYWPPSAGRILSVFDDDHHRGRSARDASPVGNGTNNVVITTAGGTPIVFTGLDTVPPENLVGKDGGTDLVFALIDVQVVNATPQQNISIPFTFDVTITDYPTDNTTDGPPDGSGIFHISGSISGKLGPGRKVNMNNIVLNPVAPILIGGDLYSMNLNTIVPPGPFFAGAIGACRNRPRAGNLRAAGAGTDWPGNSRSATLAQAASSNADLRSIFWCPRSHSRAHSTRARPAVYFGRHGWPVPL